MTPSPGTESVAADFAVALAADFSAFWLQIVCVTVALAQVVMHSWLQTRWQV